MITYKLYGISEGVLGKAEVKTSSFRAFLKKYPQLKKIKSKIFLKKRIIMGFAACDG